MHAPDASESRVEQLWPEVAKATSITDRLRRLVQFFDGCEEALQAPDHQSRYNVFHQISYLLSEPAGEADTWDWLQEKARCAHYERQSDMRIAIFELVPEPPIIWRHVFRLWDMWFDPLARWAVYAAYCRCPHRVQPHLRRYVAHRRRHGLLLPEFSHEEFQGFLQRHGG